MSVKSILRITISTLAIALVPSATFAHVVVTPSRAGIGSTQLYSVSVPNEGTTNVIKIALDIPSTVANVIPTGMSGWKIDTITDPSRPDTISQISWSDGVILPGQRQDFTFSAQAPATASDINWKAYETDTAGMVTHWDQVPAGSDDSTGTAGPYSVTKVVNDLTSAPSTPQTSSSTSLIAIIIAGFALLISIISLVIQKKK